MVSYHRQQKRAPPPQVLHLARIFFLFVLLFSLLHFRKPAEPNNIIFRRTTYNIDMVRFVVTASAIVYFLQSSYSVDAFVPVSPVTQQRRGTNVHAPARLLTVEQRAVTLPSISLAVDTASLTQYFLETLISSGIPAIFWIAVIGFAAKSIKNAKDAGNNEGPNGGLFGRTGVTELYDDLYGPSGGGQRSLLSFGRGAQKTMPKNIGIPTNEFLKITKLNSKYESFEYSLTAATQSKAKAAAKYRSRAFDSALQRSFDSSISELNSAQKSDLLVEEKEFLKQGSDMLNSINELQRQLTELVISEEMRSMDVEIGEVDAYGEDGKKILDATIVKEEKDGSSKVKDGKKKKKSDKKTLNKLVKEIQKVNTDLLKLEMEFIRAGKEGLSCSIVIHRKHEHADHNISLGHCLCNHFFPNISPSVSFP